MAVVGRLAEAARAVHSRPLSPRGQRGLFALAVLTVACVMFALNALSPLVADDYGTIAKMRDVASAEEFFSVVWDTYLQWDGRMVSATFAHLFAMFDKSVFNVVNTMVFVAFTLVLFAHGAAGTRLRVSGYVLVCLLIWFTSPVFGQTFLWFAGTTVHLWPLVAVLCFMLPYRMFRDTSSRPGGLLAPLSAGGMFTFGVVAGWSSTNVSAAMIAWTALLIARLRRQGVSPPTWMWAGLAGCVAGYVALLAAPGNWVRSAGQAHEVGAIERFFRYLYFAFNDGVIAALAVCVALLMVLLLTGRATDAALRIPESYALAGMIAIAVMVAAPVYSPRVLLGPVAFFIIAATAMFLQIDLDDARVALPFFALAVVCSAALLVQLAGGAYDILQTSRKMADRARYITAQRDAGNLDVTVEVITPQTRFNPLWELYDVTADPGFWSNKQVAEYYGVNSVTGKLPEE